MTRLLLSMLVSSALLMGCVAQVGTEERVQSQSGALSAPQGDTMLVAPQTGNALPMPQLEPMQTVSSGGDDPQPQTDPGNAGPQPSPWDPNDPEGPQPSPWQDDPKGPQPSPWVSTDDTSSGGNHKP